jgi:hypothetical protein
LRRALAPGAYPGALCVEALAPVEGSAAAAAAAAAAAERPRPRTFLLAYEPKSYAAVLAAAWAGGVGGDGGSSSSSGETFALNTALNVGLDFFAGRLKV